MKDFRSQKGTILFISLVMLLILSIIGLTSMQNSVMQEKMTAAVRDGRIALEGAEATIHFVETQVLADLGGTGGFDNSGCLYDAGAAPIQNENGTWPADLWTGAGSCIAANVNERASSTVGGSDGSLAAAPRYFIEIAGVIEVNNPSQDIELTNYGAQGTCETQGFKIIVRSLGASEGAQKYLMSNYAKCF